MLCQFDREVDRHFPDPSYDSIDDQKMSLFSYTVSECSLRYGSSEAQDGNAEAISPSLDFNMFLDDFLSQLNPIDVEHIYKVLIMSAEPWPPQSFADGTSFQPRITDWVERARWTVACALLRTGLPCTISQTIETQTDLKFAIPLLKKLEHHMLLKLFGQNREQPLGGLFGHPLPAVLAYRLGDCLSEYQGACDLDTFFLIELARDRMQEVFNNMSKMHYDSEFVNEGIPLGKRGEKFISEAISDAERDVVAYSKWFGAFRLQVLITDAIGCLVNTLIDADSAGFVLLNSIKSHKRKHICTRHRPTQNLQEEDEVRAIVENKSPGYERITFLAAMMNAKLQTTLLESVNESRALLNLPLLSEMPCENDPEFEKDVNSRESVSDLTQGSLSVGDGLLYPSLALMANELVSTRISSLRIVVKMIEAELLARETHDSKPILAIPSSHLRWRNPFSSTQFPHSAPKTPFEDVSVPSGRDLTHTVIVHDQNHMDAHTLTVANWAASYHSTLINQFVNSASANTRAAQNSQLTSKDILQSSMWRDLLRRFESEAIRARDIWSAALSIGVDIPSEFFELAGINNDERVKIMMMGEENVISRICFMPSLEEVRKFAEQEAMYEIKKEAMIKENRNNKIDSSAKNLNCTNKNEQYIVDNTEAKNILPSASLFIVDPSNSYNNGATPHGILTNNNNDFNKKINDNSVAKNSISSKASLNGDLNLLVSSQQRALQQALSYDSSHSSNSIPKPHAPSSQSPPSTLASPPHSNSMSPAPCPTNIIMHSNSMQNYPFQHSNLITHCTSDARSPTIRATSPQSSPIRYPVSFAPPLDHARLSSNDSPSTAQAQPKLSQTDPTERLYQKAEGVIPLTTQRSDVPFYPSSSFASTTQFNNTLNHSATGILMHNHHHQQQQHSSASLGGVENTSLSHAARMRLRGSVDSVVSLLANAVNSNPEEYHNSADSNFNARKHASASINCSLTLSATLFDDESDNLTHHDATVFLATQKERNSVVEQLRDPHSFQTFDREGEDEEEEEEFKEDPQRAHAAAQAAVASLRERMERQRSTISLSASSVQNHSVGGVQGAGSLNCQNSLVSMKKSNSTRKVASNSYPNDNVANPAYNHSVSSMLSPSKQSSKSAYEPTTISSDNRHHSFHNHLGIINPRTSNIHQNQNFTNINHNNGISYNAISSHLDSQRSLHADDAMNTHHSNSNKRTSLVALSSKRSNNNSSASVLNRQFRVGADVSLSTSSPSKSFAKPSTNSDNNIPSTNVSFQRSSSVSRRSPHPPPRTFSASTSFREPSPVSARSPSNQPLSDRLRESVIRLSQPKSPVPPLSARSTRPPSLQAPSAQLNIRSESSASFPVRAASPSSRTTGIQEARERRARLERQKENRAEEFHTRAYPHSRSKNVKDTKMRELPEQTIAKTILQPESLHYPQSTASLIESQRRIENDELQHQTKLNENQFKIQNSISSQTRQHGFQLNALPLISLLPRVSIASLRPFHFEGTAMSNISSPPPPFHGRLMSPSPILTSDNQSRKSNNSVNRNQSNNIIQPLKLDNNKDCVIKQIQNVVPVKDYNTSSVFFPRESFSSLPSTSITSTSTPSQNYAMLIKPPHNNRILDVDNRKEKINVSSIVHSDDSRSRMRPSRSNFNEYDTENKENNFAISNEAKNHQHLSNSSISALGVRQMSNSTILFHPSPSASLANLVIASVLDQTDNFNEQQSTQQVTMNDPVASLLLNLASQSASPPPKSSAFDQNYNVANFTPTIKNSVLSSSYMKKPIM